MPHPFFFPFLFFPSLFLFTFASAVQKDADRATECIVKSRVFIQEGNIDSKIDEKQEKTGKEERKERLSRILLPLQKKNKERHKRKGVGQ